MKKIFFALFSLFISLSVFAQPKCEETQFSTAEKTQIQEPLKIVFQLSIGDTLAHKALMKQIGNITSVEPTTLIEVVCHGPGLDMLRKDKSTVTKKIDEFSQKGVVFNACEFSMKERNVTSEQIISSSKFVKAGIIYIVTKQREGYSYIKSGF
jgi:intracellular sulfur oxidation DsrE/DsrF family protein